MLETILNPNLLMMIGYLCFVGAAVAAAGLHWWKSSDTRQQWERETAASRVRGAR